MRLYLMNIDEAAKIPSELGRKLFPIRMERSKKFLRREDALRSIAGGLLIEAATGAHEDEISYNEWGKPQIERLAFNLSHSGEYAVLAMDTAAVGVDIEKKTEIPEGVAERVFTAEELLWMNEGLVELAKERFWKLWTIKESVMKLDGRGLSLPPETFSALPLLRDDSIKNSALTQEKVAEINPNSITFEHKEIYGKTFDYDGHTISICSFQPIDDVEIKIVRAEDF